MKNILVCAAVIALLPNAVNAASCSTCPVSYPVEGAQWTNTGIQSSGGGNYFTTQGSLPTASSTYYGVCATSCYSTTYAALYTCGLGYRTTSAGATGYYATSTDTNTRVYGSTSGFVCIICPHGSYNGVYGGTICTLCPGGYMTTGGGASSCRYPCSGYNYTESWKTPVWADGVENSTVESLCVASVCKAGAYMDNSKCVACPAGTYNPSSGATSSSACKPCPAPTDIYVDSSLSILATATSDVGSSACWLAPGTYYDKTGAFEITENCEY